MPADELIRHGQHVLTVCNACRYCEQYCPVFPAMERRLTFEAADLAYLANLCHNCGECLYACQYAPPHEFGINVPHTLAEIRLQSYEELCWPSFMAIVFRRSGIGVVLALITLFSILLLGATRAVNSAAFDRPAPAGDFYGVIP